nr:peptide deformylase [Rhodobacter sp. NTK016B]
MPVKSLIQYPDARLGRVSRAITEVDDTLRSLARDLLDTMYACGAGSLSAPQIGGTSRVLVIDDDWQRRGRDPRICVNPAIMESAQSLVVNQEHCLSIPELTAWIARPDWIVLRWLDLDGLQHTELLSDFDGIAAQHGLDLLDGRLLIDRMDAVSRDAAEAQLSKLRMR